MGVFKIEYYFAWDGGHADFELEFDQDSIALLNPPSEEIPYWAKLDYYKCPNCPLDSNEVEYCPAAVSFLPVIERFENVDSSDEVEVQVIVPTRRIFMTAPAHRAISSVVGLLFTSSGCPHTKYFRSMVRYHVPVSSETETIMRSMSMYALAQLYKYKTGEKPDMDLEGLRNIYDELQTVNMTMAERLRSIEGALSSTNSVILLDMYTKIVPEEIDNSLKDLSCLFKSFLG